MHSSFFVKLDVKIPGEQTKTVVRKSFARSYSTPDGVVSSVLQDIVNTKPKLVAMVTDKSSFEVCREQDEDPLVVQAARIAHEVNRTLCEIIGEPTVPTWDEAPAWHQSSTLAGVLGVLANPDITPEQSHENWVAHKRSEGWVYGERKDTEKKTHPCMVDYDQLPIEQKAKDLMFVNTVRAALGIPTDRARATSTPLRAITINGRRLCIDRDGRALTYESIAAMAGVNPEHNPSLVYKGPLGHGSLRRGELLRLVDGMNITCVVTGAA